MNEFLDVTLYVMIAFLILVAITKIRKKWLAHKINKNMAILCGGAYRMTMQEVTDVQTSLKTLKKLEGVDANLVMSLTVLLKSREAILDRGEK